MPRYARADDHCPRTLALCSADVHTTIPLIFLFGSQEGYIITITNPGKINRMAQEQKWCVGYVTDSGHRLTVLERSLVGQQHILVKPELLLGMVDAENLVDKERDESKQLPDGTAEAKAGIAFCRRQLEPLKAYRRTATGLDLQNRRHLRPGPRGVYTCPRGAPGSKKGRPSDPPSQSPADGGAGD